MALLRNELDRLASEKAGHLQEIATLRGEVDRIVSEQNHSDQERGAAFEETVSDLSAARMALEDRVVEVGRLRGEIAAKQTEYDAANARLSEVCMYVVYLCVSCVNVCTHTYKKDA
jgi:hypothetical protein